MYELVKQKSTIYRIIFGIIIFAFIGFVLRTGFSKPATTLNDDLVAAANQVNAHAPIIVDSTTRFDRVEVLPGNVYQYNYTLTSYEQSQIDTNRLKSNWRGAMIGKGKKDPKMSVFRDNGVILQAKFVDKNGDYLATISVGSTEY